MTTLQAAYDVLRAARVDIDALEGGKDESQRLDAAQVASRVFLELAEYFGIAWNETEFWNMVKRNAAL